MEKDLHLNWVNLEKAVNSSGSGKFLDYLLSGQSLKDYLGIGSRHDVTPFGWFSDKKEESRALQEIRLQAKSKLVDNRVELYICGACGDIGCGSITARVIDGGDKIFWSQFAIQSNPEEIGDIINVEAVEFERNNYFRALSLIK